MAFQLIDTVYGFNHMAVNGVEVHPNREIFLRQPGGGYLSLGSFEQAANRAGHGNNHVIGVNGVHLGNFGTPQIDNNLFVRVIAPGVTGIAAPAAGGRSRRSRRSRRSKRSRRSRRSRRSKRSRRSRKR